MNGIGAIQSGGLSAVWQQARYYMGISAARAAAANPARVETPVEPVAPVKALGSDVPVRFPISVQDTPLPTVEDLNNASENLARMRIQYPETEPEGLPMLREMKIAGLENEADRKQGELEDLEDEMLNGVWESKSPAEIMDDVKCETCEKRKYQDGSDDPGVSFKSPTTISADQAESAVRGHEQEHVVRERAKAEMEGRKVVSQSVSIHTDICPECGRVYISGGTTRTVTMNDDGNSVLPEPEDEDKTAASGSAA